MRTRAHSARASASAPRRQPPRRAVQGQSNLEASTTPKTRATRSRATRVNYAISSGEGEDEDEDEDEVAEADEDDDASPYSDDDSGSFAAPPPATTRSKRTRSDGGSQSTSTPKAKRPRRHIVSRNASRRETREQRSEDRAYPSPASNDETSGSHAKAKGHAGTPKKHQSRAIVKKAQGEVAVQDKDDAKIIPPWESLPYMILVQIFKYASVSLPESQSVRWLAAAGRTCRAFAEPAMTALYRQPPLLTMPMAHNLLALLSQDPSSTLFNYRQKVEVLEIDVGVLARHVYKGQHLDISSLVSSCPRLADLDIYHFKDMSPYRQLDDNLRWVYPSGLFDALGARQPEAAESQHSNSSPIKLKSWRWSQRMMGKDMTLDDIEELHLSPAFASLRKVSFVNYQRPSLKAKNAEAPEAIEEDKQYAVAFASLLTALPDLKHLVIESSTAANEMLLPLLPKTLEHLELINCWDVTAEHLAEYLLSHGRELRYLTLHHNQSLSLAFLPILGDACPNLRAIRMNLTYYSHHEFYNDSNPMYEQLLLEDQVPSWPAGLEVIEMENMRKWEAPAAEMFFQSLVENARRLPMLRHLVIKAMLDIPWRQRSQMRDKWVAKLKEVFQREPAEPKPISSLREREAEEADQSLSRPAKKPARKGKDHGPSRRSNRIALQVSAPSSRASSVAQGRRRLDGGRISYREPDSDEDIGDESESEGAPSADETAEAPPSSSTGEAPFIQGLCDVVDIRFDNQKPMETQFGMDDFLDSDNANSDEEWTGDESVDAAEYAW